MYTVDRSKFDAGLFDLDGTLVETERELHKAWGILTDRAGADFSSFDYRKIIGRPGTECCRIVSEHFGLGKDPEAWIVEYRKIVAELVYGHVDPRPGATSILRRFVAEGKLLALVTSGTAMHASKAFFWCEDLRPFSGQFSVRITADTPGLRARKPNPAPYLLAAAAMGVDPARCLAFEDSPTGVRSAVAAGCWTIAVPHPHSPPENLRQAHMVLDSLEEFDFHS